MSMTAHVMDTPTVLIKELRNQQRQDTEKNHRLTIETRFGNNVRTLRKGRGMTQEQLALRIHCHQHYISEIERGKRNVSLRVVETIAQALGVSEKALF